MAGTPELKLNCIEALRFSPVSGSVTPIVKVPLPGSLVERTKTVP